MDYKEKYEMALERAKLSRLQLLNIGEEATEIEYIFPELAESEDERIRKEIIDFLWKEKIFLQEVHSSVENSPKYRFVMDAIAWLEKQGEKPIFEFKANDWYVSKVDGKIHDMTYIPNAVEQSKWSENDEDSKVNDETNAPTGYGKYVDECLNEASKHFFSEGEDKYSVADLFYDGVRCGKSWFEKQGKPKWTEEDEKRIERICNFVWKNRKGDTDEIFQQEQDVNWLKSLKQKLTE